MSDLLSLRNKKMVTWQHFSSKNGRSLTETHLKASKELARNGRAVGYFMQEAPIIMNQNFSMAKRYVVRFFVNSSSIASSCTQQ